MGGDLVTECIVAARAERRRRETPLCKGGRKRKTRWDRDYPEYLKEDFRRWKRKSRWDDDWEEERYRRLDEEERQWEEEMKELDAMFERDQQREWRRLETSFKPLFGEETDPEMIALDRRRMELHRISRHKGGLNEEELQELRLAVKKLIARERDVINANWGLDEGDIRLADITYVVNAEFRTFDLRDGRLILKADKIGNFSFKSAYNLIREQRGNIASIHHLRNPKLEKNISVFMWRLINSLLPFDNILKRMKFNLRSKCPLCMHEDSLDHFYNSCPFALNVWKVMHQFKGIADSLIPSGKDRFLPQLLRTICSTKYHH